MVLGVLDLGTVDIQVNPPVLRCGQMATFSTLKGPIMTPFGALLCQYLTQVL